MKFFLIFCMFFSTLLGNSFKGSDFDELKSIDVRDYYVSEYLDGMGANWDGKKLYNNHNQTYEISKEFTKDFPPFEIKGLLFCGTDYYDTFNDVMLNKLKCAKFYVVDVPNQKGDLKDRLNYLRDYLKEHPNKNITFVVQNEFNSEDEFIDFFNEVILKESEGVYLHKKNTDYDVPRQDKIVQIRKFYKDNCVISKTNLNNEGKLINYECQWKKINALRALTKFTDEKLNNNELTTITIGSGFNINEINKPLNIGTKIAFKYYKLDKDGKPMHSVFIRSF
ncbi:hypothetical protein AVBRAN9334_02930 [Campylobacter sp. RM9334]|uniref:hypothetical protein n=1 Tax=unclassified Campylobacter TaxID=2593542 RepID=UPI001D400E01|nr:hypothetical protein [Campylobacter sp. RM12637]MBZ7978192.1 hypothetical protein [Campylobacter sp. RM12654]MBZ8007101.1 hypothetical protein [Campylobacter sp. RM9334]